MREKFVSLRFRDMVGKVAAGALMAAMGVFRIAGWDGPAFYVVSIACITALLCTVFSGASRRRERSDEMYREHMGLAATSTFWTCSILLSLIALVGLHLDLKVDLLGAADIAWGVSCLVYGIHIVRLEGSVPCADD